MTQLALQDLAAPEGVCFGCGSKNKEGLRIKSYWDEEYHDVIANFTPASIYMGWPYLVYGGLISCLIDCHSNWTAIAHHYRLEGREPDSLPRIHCVTGILNIHYKKPTPMGVPLFLKAHVIGKAAKKTRVYCEVYAADVLTCFSDSIFIRVDIDTLIAPLNPQKHS